MTRKLSAHEMGKDKSRIKEGGAKRFLGYSALAAGLMLGCAGNVPGTSTLSNPRPPLTSIGAGFGVDCKDSKSLSTDQVMWFGVTWRSMYGVRVITFDENIVLVDMAVPAGISENGSDAMKSVAVRFNGVEMPRPPVEKMFEAACTLKSDVSSQAKSEPDLFKGPDRRKVRAKDEARAVAAQMNKKGLLNKLAGAALAPWEVLGDKPPALAVVRSDENEFVLKVVGGPHDDKRIRLDRRLELSIENLSDKGPATVTEVQYNIVSLTSDSRGRLNVSLALASKTAAVYNLYATARLAPNPRGSAGDRPAHSPFGSVGQKRLAAETMEAAQKAGVKLQTVKPLKVEENLFIRGMEKTKNIIE